MKRLLAFLPLFVFVLSVASCGETGDRVSAAGLENSGIGDGGGGEGGFISEMWHLVIKYPSTTIYTPSDRRSYDEGDFIAFNGSSVDEEGVALDSSLLIWTSNIDGEIGTGMSFTTNSLSPGLHLITLSLKDIISENDQVRMAVGPVASYHDTVIKTISVGMDPTSIVITSDSKYVYVANSLSDSVSVIRTSDNIVVDTISVGNYPIKLAISPDGANIYVAYASDKTISVIQTSTNTVESTFLIPSTPTDIIVSPDGNFLYVATFLPSGLFKYNTSDSSYAGSVSGIIYQPELMRVAPDGSHIYTSDSWNPIQVVSTLNDTVIGTIAPSVNYPAEMAISYDGFLYVAGEYPKISVIQTSDDTEVDTFPVSFITNRIIIPDSFYIYMLNQNNNTMAVLQRAGKTIIDEIPIGGWPRDMAITPDGNYVYVLNSSNWTVSVIAKSDWPR